jgi:hypothetical protein
MMPTFFSFHYEWHPEAPCNCTNSSQEAEVPLYYYRAGSGCGLMAGRQELVHGRRGQNASWVGPARRGWIGLLLARVYKNRESNTSTPTTVSLYLCFRCSSNKHSFCSGSMDSHGALARETPQPSAWGRLIAHQTCRSQPCQSRPLRRSSLNGDMACDAATVTGSSAGPPEALRQDHTKYRSVHRRLPGPMSYHSVHRNTGVPPAPPARAANMMPSIGSLVPLRYYSLYKIGGLVPPVVLVTL